MLSDGGPLTTGGCSDAEKTLPQANLNFYGGILNKIDASTYCFSAGDEGLGRGEACDSGSSVTSAEQDRNVAALSQTCVMLQSQVRNSQDQASTSPVQVILKQ